MISSFILRARWCPMMANYLLRRHGSHHTARSWRHDSETGRTAAQPAGSLPARLRAAFETIRGGYRDSDRSPSPPAQVHRRLYGFRARLFRPGAVSGPELLSRGRLRRDQLARPRAGGHAHRGDRGPVRPLEAEIRSVIPPDQLDASSTISACRLAASTGLFSNTGGIGPEDGDILITLSRRSRPTADYVKAAARRALPRSFPGSTFAFLPADIISQILNFGAPAPIDVHVAGPEPADERNLCEDLLKRIATVPGAPTYGCSSPPTIPNCVDVDRTRAGQLGITERDVTNSLVVNLSGSFQMAPAFWLNPRTAFPIRSSRRRHSTGSTRCRSGEHPGHGALGAAMPSSWAV